MTHRILVVDDYDDARDALVALLRVLGHEVAEAATGPEGLAAARVFQPHVVILDLDLPEIDGCALAGMLRHDLAHPPFLIALTGWNRASDHARATAAGFDAYALKPWNMDEMETLLARVGSRRRTRA